MEVMQLELELPGRAPHIRDKIFGAIEAGRAARIAGKPRTANPHPAGTFFFSLWLDGWRAE